MMFADTFQWNPIVSILHFPDKLESFFFYFHISSFCLESK